jgi:curved DNA-binding protein CbpA
MSDDTYYTVLGISESATQDEIKRAYRDVIRQVHPDCVPNASPYWRRTAEERSKEINEAYHVLAEPSQRLSYNAQLAKYRGRPVPVPPSPLKVHVTVPPRSHNRPPYPGRPQKRAGRRAYNWQPLKRWAAKYPLLACSLGVLVLLPAVSLFTGLRQNKAATATDSAAAFESSISAFPCLDPRDTVSPIDGKPCGKPEGTALTSEAIDAKPLVKHTTAAAQPVPAANSYPSYPCGEKETISDVGHKPCKASSTPKWFYIASDGIHPLGGEPDDDTCKRINAKNFSACRASLKFCPRGVWAKDCVSYLKWKKNVDTPRQEKWIPAWPPV